MEDPVSIWKVSGISGQDPDAGDWLFLTDVMSLRREHPVQESSRRQLRQAICHRPKLRRESGRGGARFGIGIPWNSLPVAGQMKGMVLCPKSVIRLAGAFPMGEMVLSGILSVSVRILFLATPRRSPLRLRPGGKHAA